MVVSATGTQTPESQVGASISVLGHSEIEDADHEDISDDLRTIPGAQVMRTGRMGGLTSLYVRGGGSDFNKLLIDGVPANDIGGSVNFAYLATAGIDEVEILRGPNSALYGSDGLGSVINLTTRRGLTSVPEITYSADGGNFNTMRQDGSIGGVYRRFDYFSEFARFDTRNGLPNDSFHNGTYAGNLGWAPSSKSELRLTVHRNAVKAGDPNAIAFYGVPDASWEQGRDTYLGVTAQNQTTPRWHNLARFAFSDLHYSFTTPYPSGTVDANGDYLGNTVTICGANGYCTSGSAILDYAGTYPSTYTTSTTRRSVYAQSDYQVHPDLGITAGFRYEHESGSGQRRDNYSGILEGRASLAHRLFVTAGVGLDQNAVFGFAATPRVSAAYYLRQPSTAGFFSDTKLKFNFATGIKEPNTYQQASSLYQVLLQTPGGPALISQYGIAPVNAERSRSFDFGVDQGFWTNRARLGVTFFHAQYFDLIEYLSQGALILLGVPPALANAPALAFGAYTNSDSYWSRGVEVELKASIGHGLLVRGNYTYLDAVVTRSFTSDALTPSYNYNGTFPAIPFGIYSPLIGARPFNLAPHSGSLVLDYTHRKFGVALSGSFVGRRDGSTYLTDPSYGYSALGFFMDLPNRNLQAAYQVVDLSGRYAVNSHVSTYVSIANLFDQRYQADFGYPALPLAFRAGMKFTFGGESGWR